MRAWYLDEPSKTLTPREVHDLLGIVTYHVSRETPSFHYISAVKRIQYMGVHFEWSAECDPDLSILLQLKKFELEHKHPDEEIRYFEHGTGYFDVRDADDHWVRIELSDRDLFVLPANTYHRFQPKTPKASCCRHRA
ncbi:unnamed protein product [Ixodes hexagonus]